LILQVVAIIHFIRHRPETYWIFIIIFLGPVGALIYLIVEALPDFVAFSPAFRNQPRRKRITELAAIVRENPSAANYEELGDLLMDEGRLAEARNAFDSAIGARSDTLECFYRRGVCALKTGDAAGAIPDLERVVKKEPNHDFYRAAGLLAHAHALSGDKKKAESIFLQAIERSTLAETYLNFAEMLAAEGRKEEARQWAQKVLDRELTMPKYLRRREQKWFRSANEMLKRLAV